MIAKFFNAFFSMQRTQTILICRITFQLQILLKWFTFQPMYYVYSLLLAITTTSTITTFSRLSNRYLIRRDISEISTKICGQKYQWRNQAEKNGKSKLIEIEFLYFSKTFFSKFNFKINCKLIGLSFPQILG